ncbi:MAG: hypothetical protein M1822_004420 [Bathelium mastoideum]|nr:MAG: hypothetical protein M1822_004420 [Bathelium mastoideum]
MRFRAIIKDVNTFSKLAASLSSLGHVAWLRMTSDDIRFTIIPEQGTQVWASRSERLQDNLFEEYTIQSAAENNTINLEVPLAPLQRALKSALSSISASIRLTKKDNIPLLALTITTSSYAPPSFPPPRTAAHPRDDEFGAEDFDAEDFTEDMLGTASNAIDLTAHQSRDIIITQEVPVRVLTATSVEGLHEPRCREPDVHIMLPPLLQLKSVSDRFTKLALASKPGSGGNNASFVGVGSGRRGPIAAAGAAGGIMGSASSSGARLEMLANMHGGLRLALRTDAMSIASSWTGLTNPELDPAQVEGAEQGVALHPSTTMRERQPDEEGDEGWARVRIDGRDWGRVLGVGRLGGRVIACEFSCTHLLSEPKIIWASSSGNGVANDHGCENHWTSREGC